MDQPSLSQWRWPSIAALALLSTTACKLLDLNANPSAPSAVPEGPYVGRGSIASGQIITQSENESTILSEIREQLAFVVGALAGRQVVGDLTRLKIVLGDSIPSEQGGRQVAYLAEFPLSGPAAALAPLPLVFALPSRGDRQGLARFYAAFRPSCADPQAGDVNAASFWFAYRPDRPGCLAQPVDGYRRIVAALSMTVTPVPAPPKAAAQVD